MTAVARRAVRALLSSAASGSLCWPLLRGRATILMLHRFRMPDHGVEGHDPALLRRVLATLHREGYAFRPIDELLADLLAGRTARAPAVAFTIDDGYLDQAEVAAPAFAEFGCPVTTFVTSGFLDRDLWFWWDRIDHVLRSTKRRSLRVAVGERQTRLEWSDERERLRVQSAFTEACKMVPDEMKLAAVDALAAAADVPLPATPPARYAPMSWADLRRCEDSGMTFGPHTVTHPVLSRTSDEQSHHELTESWRRLCEEARRPVPFFCYPNGRAVDFGAREIRTLLAMGMAGAVVGEPGYPWADRLHTDETARFRIPRFAYPESEDDCRQLAAGVERLKQIVRRADT